MRLIDEAYLQACKVHGVINNVEGDFVSGVTIAHAPTVDAVKVVRCKDCTWHRDMWCWALQMKTPDDPEFFCKYGERYSGMEVKGNALD